MLILFLVLFLPKLTATTIHIKTTHSRFTGQSMPRQGPTGKQHTVGLRANQCHARDLQENNTQSVYGQINAAPGTYIYIQIIVISVCCNLLNDPYKIKLLHSNPMRFKFL